MKVLSKAERENQSQTSRRGHPQSCLAEHGQAAGNPPENKGTAATAELRH